MSARKLNEFLKPPPKPTALEVDRQWWEVRARLRRRTQLRRGAAVAALVLALGFTTLVLRSPSSPEVWQGATVSSTATPVSVSLHEGTRVQLEPQTRLQVALQSREDVLLLLDQGSVRLDVVKNPKRRFIVRAADIDVQVIGTQFDVRRSGGQISVAVHRGIVEVRNGEQIHRLTAGERWSRGGLAATDTDSDSETETQAELEADAEQGPDDLGPSAAPVRVPGTKRQLKRIRKPMAVAAAPAPAVAPSIPPAAPIAEPAPTVPAATPRSVFDAAVQARSKGNPKEAISRFEQLLQQWPDSTFAPLSAFELGRLQMDSRRDPRAAALAFEKVLAIASESSLSEDAMGRLVEAYASFDLAACRKARARYLSAFPSGTHAKDVSSSCPP